MDLRLMELRKKKGFKNRAQFAERLCVSTRRVKSWERGETLIQLDDACMAADVLGCTLDELVGRTPPQPETTDPLLDSIHEDYASLSFSGKVAAAGAIHGIRRSEENIAYYAGDMLDTGPEDQPE